LAFVVVAMAGVAVALSGDVLVAVLYTAALSALVYSLVVSIGLSEALILALAALATVAIRGGEELAVSAHALNLQRCSCKTNLKDAKNQAYKKVEPIINAGSQAADRYIRELAQLCKNLRQIHRGVSPLYGQRRRNQLEALLGGDVQEAGGDSRGVEGRGGMTDRRNSRASLTARAEKLADYITRRLTKMDVLIGINQLLCDMARSNKRQSYTRDAGRPLPANSRGEAAGIAPSRHEVLRVDSGAPRRHLHLRLRSNEKDPPPP
jgi:hypothetical protein